MTKDVHDEEGRALEPDPIEGRHQREPEKAGAVGKKNG